MKGKQPVVPQVVLQAFAKDYPGTKATWDAEKTEDLKPCSWSMGLKPQQIIPKPEFASHLKWEINVTDLPAAVTSYVKTNYSLYKLTEANQND